jgi:hypothetical protein
MERKEGGERMEERRRRTKREARGEMLDGRSQKPEGKSPDRVAKGIERSSAWMKGEELGRCTMGRRRTPRPEHQGPHEQHLREIVDELVQEESQKAAYVHFGMELVRAERRQQPRERTKAGDSPPSARRQFLLGEQAALL